VGIITLPCAIGPHHAVSFDVFGVRSDRIFLIDLSAKWNEYAPVTEAASEVFQYCKAAYGNKRIICDDDGSNWHEIIPENGTFNIAPYDDGLPFWVACKYHLAPRNKYFPVQ
jgi:hypothetical protein